MFRPGLFAALFALCLGGVPFRFRPRLDGRIVGGAPTEITEHPHQISMEVSLGYYNGHYCGGSIISTNWVLLAAHCVNGLDSSEVSIRDGTTIVESGGSLHTVSDMIMHPQFGSSLDYDVAVIKVNEPFEYSDAVQPISMIAEDPAAGSVVTVTGWGALESGGSSPSQLQEVQVNVVSNDECNEAYGSITPRMLCAGVPEGGKDSCQGDSGGPLVSEGKLAGIVSWGRGCAQQGYPGVYSDVAALRSWVTSVTDVN